MATVEAQDLMAKHTYSDGRKIFKVKRAVAIGTHSTQIVTTTGAVMLFKNEDTLFDRASDVIEK